MDSSIPWSEWKQASCLPDCWCEAPRFGQWIIEPSNTWSNLSFVVIGVYILLHYQKLKSTNPDSHLVERPIYSQVFGWVLILLGLGSGFYHASMTHLGQWLDNSAMYWITSFIIVYNFGRISDWKPNRVLGYYLLINTPMMAIAYYLPQIRRELFGVSLVLALIVHVYSHRKQEASYQSKYFWGALGCYIVAQSFWLLDVFKVLCDPYAWINGHAIWHFLTGMACLCYYFYLASERNSKKPSMA